MFLVCFQNKRNLRGEADRLISILVNEIVHKTVYNIGRLNILEFFGQREKKIEFFKIIFVWQK